MKLPSFHKIIASAISALKRFPFAIAFAIIGVIACVIAFDKEVTNYDHKFQEFLVKIGLFSLLGFLISISSTLLAESKSWYKAYKLGIQFFFAALVILYFFLTPELKEFKKQEGILLALFCLASMLSISVAPFINRNSASEFWSFSKNVISRFFVSAFYGITLFGGLALALLAIHFLFQVDIRDYRYGQLFFIFFFLFGSWHFAARIPSMEEFTIVEQDYPKGLKLFTQFVLIPLVTIYFIILYAYAGRILVLWELPQGWVSYLVLALSAIGILSFLFVWPLRNNEGNSWIKTYSHYFFIALAPLSVLLYVAILRRISDYGFTPNRYYIFVSSVWVGVMIFYFIFSKKKNIKIIPASLAIIALLVGFGPWSAYPVSEKNQINRLDEILSENHAFIAGQPDTLKTSQLNDSICSEINQITDFLEDCENGLKHLEEHWNMDLKGDYEYREERSLDRHTVAQKLKLKNTSTYYYEKSSNRYFYWRGKENNLLNISDYNYMMKERYLSGEVENGINLNLQSSYCNIYFSKKKLVLTDDDEIITKSMPQYIELLKSNGYNVENNYYSNSEDNNMNFEMNSSRHKFLFNVSELEGYYTGDSINVSGLRFILLIKKK